MIINPVFGTPNLAGTVEALMAEAIGHLPAGTIRLSSTGAVQLEGD